MAVAQEVHHGHLHLGEKPAPLSDAELEAKVAEAENASVSWLTRHLWKGGQAQAQDIP